MKIPNAKKLPSGSWFIRLRLGGQEIGVTRPTERDCINAARLIKAEYLAGKKAAQSEEKSLTLGQAINRYIKSRENILSPSTIRGYQAIKSTRFLNYMSKNIQKIDFQAMCNAESRLCAPKTLVNAWRFVASALRYADFAPPAISLPQVPQNEKPFLSPDQIIKFMDVIRGEWFEIPALLALHSLRLSEIMGLRWENVDLKNSIITVRGAAVKDANGNLVWKPENKNRSSARAVPIMTAALKDALERENHGSPMVVTCHPDSLRRAINRVCADHDLPQVGVHGLRHSFASLAYHLQIPEQIAMEMGGWSDIATMRKIYTHIAQSDINRYSTKMQEFFKKRQ